MSAPDLPLRVIAMLFGGQVEKKPAVEPTPVKVAVMRVVPGMTAVMALVVLFRVATEVVPTEKEGVPMTLEQEGTVAEDGAQSRTWEVEPSALVLL